MTVRVEQADYDRAWGFVLGHLRRQGKTQTSLRPLAIIAWLLFSIPLFVLVSGPSYLHESDRQLIRWSVLALVLVPLLFAFGVSRLRRADARALQPLAPSTEEPLHLVASSTEFSASTETMRVAFPWSAVSIFVLDPQFVVLLAPRVAPFPLPLRGTDGEAEYYTFVRHAQQYKEAASAT
ncbi:MAG: hypothetical protein AB7I35_08695 [Ramlibacter sp.]